MPLTNRPPDLEARVSFLKKEEGGKSGPAHSGYRPSHNFGVPNMLNDAAHECIGCESVAPGESAIAKVWLLAPEYQVGRLHEGFEFTVQEGNRVVGRGVITKVINATLQTAA